MSESEWRSYKLRGELPPEQWRTVVDMLGMLGLSVIPTDEQTKKIVTSETAATTIYGLTEITSGDMYVGIEHACEFLPVFLHEKKKGVSGIEEHQAALAFRFITEPAHRNGSLGMTATATRGYAESLGLQARDRSEAGFPAVEQSNTVVTAASFIAVVRELTAANPVSRPKFISQKNLPFLNAFADRLEKQIAGFEIPVTMDTDNSSAMPGNPA